MNLQELPDSGDAVEPANENFEALDWASVYAKDATTTSSLTWGYLGGRWAGFSVTADTVTLTDDATNYIVVQRSDGALSVSSSSTNWDNTADYARVYKVVTADGAVSGTPEDHRAGAGGIHANRPSTVEQGGVSIVTEATNDVSYTMLAANASKYHRFTGTGAKTATFDNSGSPQEFQAPQEYHLANRAASGNLTLVGTDITLNAPKGGTLVLEPGDTVTVKFISDAVADVFGSTEDA